MHTQVKTLNTQNRNHHGALSKLFCFPVLFMHICQPTIDPYVPIVRLRIVSETPVAQSLRALEEGSAYAAVDATGFAALEDAHLTNCSDVEVVINTASSSSKPHR